MIVKPRLDSLPPSHFEVVLAKPEDVDIVLGILDEAAAWIIEQRLPSVWRPGEFSREIFLGQISRGEVHIALTDGKPAGMITLQWSDPIFWGEQQPDSGCVHKLAVRPAYGGQELGLENAEMGGSSGEKGGWEVSSVQLSGSGQEDPRLRTRGIHLQRRCCQA